jgi:hypothetical protein
VRYFGAVECIRLGLALIAIALPAFAQSPLLWRDPGKIDALDLAASAGANVEAPKPPFAFVREDLSGTQPKIFARDSGGRTWNVKFGNEVKPECFGWRMARACGYFAEPSFFIASGQLQGFRPLRRKTPTLQADGRFVNARFQYRDAAVRFVEGKSWRWDAPPFAGTRELSGLKILIMLLSNWDNKDARVGGGGSNTALFERTANGRKQLIYAFTDWGSGMGRWGDASGQTDWRCEDFSEQSKEFVKGVAGMQVLFGYVGHINEGFSRGIPAAHVAWLASYLGQITDAQLQAGLRASGATESEAACFTKSLRNRIEQLRAVK